MRQLLTEFAIVCVLCPTLLAQGAATSSDDSQLRAAIERKVADLKLGSAITVTVNDHVVMYDGTIPTLHVKRELIDLARKTPGVRRVDSTMQIARPESDASLATAVTKAIQTYSRITVFDYVQGSVRNGVVTLDGDVTDKQKQEELIDRVENVRGVRDIVGTIAVLPLSPNDDRLRVIIGRGIYSNPAFVNYSPAAPPVHIIVDNGHVTLQGIVLSDVERRTAATVAGQTAGVYSVDNKIQLSSEVRATP